MTNEDFKAWRKAMGLSQKEAATALGISSGSVELYELGHRRDDGRPVVIPKTVALACMAIYHGLQPGTFEWCSQCRLPLFHCTRGGTKIRACAGCGAYAHDGENNLARFLSFDEINSLRAEMKAVGIKAKP